VNISTRLRARSEKVPDFGCGGCLLLAMSFLPRLLPLATRLGLGIAAIFSTRAVLGADSDIRIDVVVDMTDAGRSVPRPTPRHPAYYMPVVRGYTPGTGNGYVADEKQPPPSAEIERMLANTLAAQGYVLARKSFPPSLVLMFWWGYKAPAIEGPSGDQAETQIATPGGIPVGIESAIQIDSNYAAGMNQLAQHGTLQANLSGNYNAMDELVFGSEFDPQIVQNLPPPRTDTLAQASRVPRYYLMISAMDFNAAVKKKIVVLWTARVSTELWRHNLGEVLPSLISAGAPMLGRNSNGPHMTSGPIVPAGHVLVGTPVLKSYAPESAAPGTAP
jgi:hypothetical protein